MAKAKNTQKQKDLLKKAGNAGKDALLVVGGLIGGSLLSKGIDKILKVDEVQDGKLSIKSFAAPIVTIAGGAALSVFAKNDNMRLIGIGVAGSGVLKTVKVFLKKDILNGFSGLGEPDEAIQLRVDPYKPDLPEIQGADFLAIEGGMNAIEEADYEEYAEIPVS